MKRLVKKNAGGRGVAWFSGGRKKKWIEIQKKANSTRREIEDIQTTKRKELATSNEGVWERRLTTTEAKLANKPAC